MEPQDPFLERSRSRRRVVHGILRVVLVGLGLAGAGLFLLVVRAGVQRTIVEEIRKAGGKAYYKWEMTRTSRPDRFGVIHVRHELNPEPGERPPYPELLVKLLGADVFGNVMGVELLPFPAVSTPAQNTLIAPDPAEERAAVHARADALMARVGKLKHLRWLSISRVPVTDKGMEHLERLPRLETLKLSFLGGITGEGFRSIGNLMQLRTLELEALQLSDDDFSALDNLINLRSLTIQQIHLTDQGMEHLEGLHNLSKLTLREVKVRNSGLEHLRKSHHLTSLCLQSTSLDDLEKLRGLTAIRDLDVSGNPLRDDAITVIADLPDLRFFDASQTLLTNASLETLAKPPRLTNVRARDTRIRHEAVDGFRKTHTQPEIELKPLKTPAPVPAPAPAPPKS